MILSTNIRIALESLRSTRVRTALTTLGIIIGIASITMVLALGEGAKQAVATQVKHLDQNILVIRPGKVTRHNATGAIDYNPLSSYAATTLTENDLETTRKQPGVAAAAPLMLINGSIKKGEASAKDAFIVATTPELASTLKINAAQGQFLDGTTARDTVVIGESLSVALFGTDQTIGQRLKLKGQDFTIIGVLKKIKNPIGINGINFDMAAIVSLDAGKGFNQGIAQIQQLTVKAKSAAELPAIKKTLTEALLKNHDGEEDFAVLGGKEAADVSSSFFQVLTSMVAVVASISLIVGGIGIMNSMLVGVAERTREIGIRKSIGASNRHVFSQFLIESLIMSLTGGVFGFLLAYIVAYGISLFLPFHPAFSWGIFGLAMGVSLVVGVVFGLFPAFRAARKDPIVALRQHH
ncbi:MAG TPA: ABC transporter permease [Verrucomicrobiae bacterium]|nr:ABC transporter permease [Verrucomicrobiae bacterium]